jgi:hypothetical protein
MMTTPRNGVKPWLTDLDLDGVGYFSRFRTAIARYSSYYNRSMKPETPDQIRAKMVGDITGTGYDTHDMKMWVEKIISRWATSCPVLPTTDQATLDFLDVRPMCKEWVDTTAILAGGQSHPYATSGVTDQSQWRPGMAVYNGNSHAMVIIDIYWDASGRPSSYRVGEANGYVVGWDNGGQVPWLRTVRTDRVFGPSSGYKVVDLDR